MPERFNPRRNATPDGGSNGVLLVNPNPQPDIRRFTEGNRKWDYQEEASKLYRRAETVMERFYPIFDLSKFDGKLPPILIAIESLRNQNVPIVVETSLLFFVGYITIFILYLNVLFLINILSNWIKSNETASESMFPYLDKPLPSVYLIEQEISFILRQIKKLPVWIHNLKSPLRYPFV